MSLTRSAPLQLERHDEINVMSMARTVRRHWRGIGALSVACLFAAVVWVCVSTPRFTLAGSLYLGDATSVGLPSGGGNSDLSFVADFQNVSDVDTQIEMIQGSALIEQAILETGLNAPVRRAGQWRLNYFDWRFLSGHQVTAYAPQPGDLQALYATYDMPRGTPTMFDVTVGEGGTYRIDRADGWFGTTPVLTGSFGQPAAGNGFSLLLKPMIDGAMPAAGSRFVIRFLPARAVVDAMQRRGDLGVSAGGTLTAPTKIANIELLSDNPYAGKLFVDQLMNDFIATQLSWKTQAASVTEGFISDQLGNIRNSLSSADEKLAAYQAQTGILDVPTNASAVIGQLSQYEVQRTNVALQKEALEQLQTQISHPKGALNPYLVSQSNDTVLQGLASNLVTAEEQLQVLSVQLTDNAPEVQVQRASITRIEQSMGSIVNNDLALAGHNLDAMDGMIAQFEARLKSMPAQSLQVISLTRSSEVYGQLYVLLMQKAEEAAVSKAATIINTRIITPAELPLAATQPEPMGLAAVGLLAGLIGGSLIALWRHSLSGCFQTEDEIRFQVAEPVNGLVPVRRRTDARRSLFTEHAKGPFAEAFRLIRGNIYHTLSVRAAAVQAPAVQPAAGAVILVTSPGRGDGKTMVSANLAKALADDEKRVILVDADLHMAPGLKMLGASRAAGLTEWLRTGVAPVISVLPGEQFAFLPAGGLPTNPAELLNKPALAAVLDVLRQKFDYVVLDSPPLPAVSDGLGLGRHADLVLSVVRIGHTSRRDFSLHADATAILDKPHALVINGIMSGAMAYGYGMTADEKMEGGSALRRLTSRLQGRGA